MSHVHRHGPVPTGRARSPGGSLPSRAPLRGVTRPRKLRGPSRPWCGFPPSTPGLAPTFQGSPGSPCRGRAVGAPTASEAGAHWAASQPAEARRRGRHQAPRSLNRGAERKARASARLVSRHPLFSPVSLPSPHLSPTSPRFLSSHSRPPLLLPGLFPLPPLPSRARGAVLGESRSRGPGANFRRPTEAARRRPRPPPHAPSPPAPAPRKAGVGYPPPPPSPRYSAHAPPAAAPQTGAAQRSSLDRLPSLPSRPSLKLQAAPRPCLRPCEEPAGILRGKERRPGVSAFASGTLQSPRPRSLG